MDLTVLSKLTIAELQKWSGSEAEAPRGLKKQELIAKISKRRLRKAA